MSQPLSKNKDIAVLFEIVFVQICKFKLKVIHYSERKKKHTHTIIWNNLQWNVFKLHNLFVMFGITGILKGNFPKNDEKNEQCKSMPLQNSQWLHKWNNLFFYFLVGGWVCVCEPKKRRKYLHLIQMEQSKRYISKYVNCYFFRLNLKTNKIKCYILFFFVLFWSSFTFISVPFIFCSFFLFL